ncbi:neuronal acetylcholine receptor subunit beta-3-like [Ptychodera flava]|uniref:neuronal acetylcholine receptor subunit beta-3-like n=1 Tax=Ptychodera flava TaxID=63121 RepID=UPI00396A7D1C
MPTEIVKWNSSMRRHVLLVHCLSVLGLVVTLPMGTHAAEAEEKLHRAIFAGYKKYVRPVRNSSETVVFRFGLSVSQVSDVNEKDQFMETTVWLDQWWNDYRLMWNPDDYDGLDYSVIPVKWLWYPDLVLDNSVDGNFMLPVWKYATVYSDGQVWMTPPGDLRSSCSLNIRYFPFDRQRCYMTFGPWEYTANEIRLQAIKDHVVKEKYIENVEWDLVNSSVEDISEELECCPGEFYSVLQYSLVVERRPLYYIINILIPGAFMAVLTILVFYLPPDSGEKISLSISLLIALSVFSLLVADIMPPTSESLPLIGQYFLFNMTMVTLSLVMSVLVLNVHHRAGKIHRVRPWMRRLFFIFLPKLLCIDNSIFLHKQESVKEEISSHVRWSEVIYKNTSLTHIPHNNVTEENEDICCGGKRNKANKHSHFPMMPLGARSQKSRRNHDLKADMCLGNSNSESMLHVDNHMSGESNMTCFEKEMLRHMRYITNRMRGDDKDNADMSEWKYIAMVIDRTAMVIFITITSIGTCVLLLQAPHIWG